MASGPRPSRGKTTSPRSFPSSRRRSTRRREQPYRCAMASDAGEPGLRLGYACLNTLFESPARTTRLANATPERLRELLAANLDTLEAILRWNDANDIRVFRVSSNTVPLASH